MSRNAFGLGFMFTAKDAASPVMGKVDKSFRKMDKSTDKAARRMQASQGAMSIGMGALAVGAVGLGASLKAALAAGEFEQGVAKVGAISGATATELQLLSDKAIQAGLDTQFSPTEAIGGLGELAVRGLTAAESISALDGALDLAAGGQISIASASATTASALKVFGLEAGQAGLAADKLLKISNVTALQAKDLELALGTVGRGASLAKQSIDEMLPSIGLVKNTGVEASTAASSVSSALIFMAKNAKKFDKLGVSLTDTEGKIRPFMDIVLETRGALSGMTKETDKVAAATQLFGRFGISAFSAIGTQVENGIRKPTGEIVKGAEALEFLRGSMTGAAGTAKAFSKALLNTLPGQITLLKGSIQTLAITLGQPLAEALKPAVEAFKLFVNKIIGWVKKMSPQMRKLIGVVMVVTSAVLALGGAALLFGGLAAIAAPGIMAFAGAIAAAAGPLTLIAVGIAGVIGLLAVLRKAYRENIGGFADFVGPMVEKVVLFFEGLFQFIEQGFFSGDIAKKLSSPENMGIMKALVFLIGLGFRIKKFFQGVAAGWESFMKAAQPVFHMLINSLLKVEALFDDTAGAAKNALGPSEQWVKAGEKIGAVIGRIATIIVGALAIYISMWVGFIKGIKAAMKIFEPAIDQIVESMGQIVEAITDLLVELGIMDPAVAGSTDAFETLGKVLGFVETIIIGPLIGAFGMMVQAAKFTIRIFVAWVRWIKALFGGVIDIAAGLIAFFHGDWQTGWELVGSGFKKIWNGIKDTIMAVVDAITEQVNNLLDLLAKVADSLPEEGRPEWVNDFIASRTRANDAGIEDLTSRNNERFDREDRLAESFGGPAIPTFGNNTAGAAEATVQKGGGTTPDAVKEGMLAAAAQLNAGGGQKQTNITNVQVDGQTIATAASDAKAANAALGFGALDAFAVAGDG